MTEHGNRLQRRGLLKFGGAVLGLSASGCGWILYPERKGRTSGQIDVGILIIDLLWLLPGLVPGAVCLAVDFVTGCIYKGGVAEATPLEQLSPEERPALAQVVLDGQVVAHYAGAPDAEGRVALRWAPGVDLAAVRARGHLVVHRGRGAQAFAPITDLI